jgi:hypothetical protein
VRSVVAVVARSEVKAYNHKRLERKSRYGDSRAIGGDVGVFEASEGFVLAPIKV